MWSNIESFTIQVVSKIIKEASSVLVTKRGDMFRPNVSPEWIDIFRSHDSEYHNLTQKEVNSKSVKQVGI